MRACLMQERWLQTATARQRKPMQGTAFDLESSADTRKMTDEIKLDI